MSTFRHSKALTKKNFYIWKRNPFCSACELFCPAALMLVIVYIRTRIDATTTPAQNLEILKHPEYPGFDYVDGDWQSTYGTAGPQQTAFMLNDFYNTTDFNYNIQLDVGGPLYFIPTQCLKKNSFMLNKTESPLIAYVEHGSSVETSVLQYLTRLKAYQDLRGLEIPDYEFKSFATKQDLWDYV